MAVLFAQLSSSQGLFNSGNSIITSNLIIPISRYFDSLLLTNGNICNSLGQPIQSVLILIASNQYNQGNYVNYLSRLARFFGDNAKQTNTHLIIQKSDLPSLTPKLDNTAESLLIALLLYIKDNESNFLVSTITISHFKTQFEQQMITYILVLQLYALAIYSYPYPSYPYGIITNASSLPKPSEF